MFQKMLENVRGKCPLIHNITNYVTVNDCANIVLACGASPIMSDDQSEVEEITTICGGLNINIGTLNKRTIESMFLAGKRANALSHPVVLDPVGAGASKLRTETAQKLLEEVKFTVIRGNISEVKTLASGAGTTKGVRRTLTARSRSPRPLPKRRARSSPSPARSTLWRTAKRPTASETATP